MIPRVARSGNSFHGAGAYYLHDKPLTQEANKAFEGIGNYALHDKGQRQTAHRVGFTQILNMEASTPEEAIAQMGASYEAYRAKEAHKRGRKLTQPVYVYSLAWAPDQAPTPEEMKAAALSSLKALRLEGLQTLIVQHTDEPHPHVHVIINRIERDGSHARNIAFDKLRFSRWAEQYEREHGGIVCDERVKNNELRRQGVFTKDTVSLTREEYNTQERAQRFDLKKWQRQHDNFRKLQHRYDRETLWARHAKEIAKLEKKTREQIHDVRWKVWRRFDPAWERVYNTQGGREAELDWANRHGIFERAAFIYRHKELLKSVGPLRVRDVVRFALSGKALTKRLEQAHRQERVVIAERRRGIVEGGIRRVWKEHNWEFQSMHQRHVLERDGLVHVQMAEWQQVSMERKQTAPRKAPKKEASPQPEKNRRPPEIKAEQSLSPTQARQLIEDAPSLHNEFEAANRKRPKRLTGQEHAEDVERRMKEYKKRHPGRDFGREM